MVKKVGILTGGGDCPGLNAVLRAVVRRFIAEHKVECVGVLRGWRGLLDGLSMPLTLETVSGILPRGGTILRTSRTTPLDQADGPARAMATMKRFGLDALVAIGSNDTFAVAHALHKEHGLNVVGIPATIDNDVAGTEYSFGFDSTVNIAMEAIDRIHTTAESHDRVMIVEVMGRMAGWIATFAGLAGGADIILVPEKPFSMQEVCDSIVHRHDRGKDFSIVVVAEGVKVPERNGGPSVHDELNRSRMGGVAHIIAEEIERRTGYETRVTVLGHIQRGGSPTAFDRVLGARFGVAAADLAVQGRFGVAVALECNRVVAVPLEKVLQRKMVPDEIYDVAKAFFG